MASRAGDPGAAPSVRTNGENATLHFELDGALATHNKEAERAVKILLTKRVTLVRTRTRIPSRAA
jgi:hypothetical protein